MVSTEPEKTARSPKMAANTGKPMKVTLPKDSMKRNSPRLKSSRCQMAVTR